MPKQKEKIKKGDIVEITWGWFKGFTGEFVGICQKGESKKYGWTQGKKWDGKLMIKINNLARVIFIPCDEIEIKLCPIPKKKRK